MPHPKTDLLLTVDASGRLEGSSASGALPEQVNIRHRDADWAVVPSFAVQDTAERRFSCDLPPSPSNEPGGAVVEVLDGDRRLLSSIRVDGYAAKRNGQGVSAREVLALHSRPFFGAPYFSFDGARITITGAHLPPEGDPAALDVEFGPG